MSPSRDFGGADSPSSPSKSSSDGGERRSCLILSACSYGRGHPSSQGPCAYATTGIEESGGDDTRLLRLAGTFVVPSLELRGENHRFDPSWSYLAMATFFCVVILMRALLGIGSDNIFRVKTHDLTLVWLDSATAALERRSLP